MINESRMITQFSKLVSFDSESFRERKIADYLKETLQRLGLEVFEDESWRRMGHENPDMAGNVYAYLGGNADGESILFSAHMDTVSPGNGKKAIREGDVIHSDGTTVLGADDVAGLVSILEALEVIREDGIPHPDIEILFSAAEEPYGAGSGSLEAGRLRSRIAYVLDLTGKVGTAALAAPSILSIKADIHGRAAHAGFQPEAGINALSIAAKALTSIRTGHVSEDTTLNFGLINGGEGRNIVPEHIRIEGEVRSLDNGHAWRVCEAAKDVFERTASDAGGSANIKITEKLRAYRIGEDDPVVLRFRNAMKTLGYGEPELVTTFGGSDNNNLNLHGIHGIVLANAMNRVHTVFETTSVRELIKSASLTLELMKA